jgi:pimeloyl-ACP methyl ester carboxylesterase
MTRIDEADEALDAGEIDRGVELELQLWIDGPNRRPEEVDARVRERVREMNGHNYREVAQEGVPRLPEVPAAQHLSEIAVPTLILVGDQDVPDMHAIADVLDAEIQDTERHVIQGAAHHPNMEQPEEFNRLVLDFLRRRGGG